ncbi:hypothetical protein [Aliterella atlantica]
MDKALMQTNLAYQKMLLLDESDYLTRSPNNDITPKSTKIFLTFDFL